MTTIEKIKHAAALARHIAADLNHVAMRDLPNLATASRTVIIGRTFAARPDQIFHAFTEPYAIARWWGPKGFTTENIQIDLRVGGRWSNTMVGPDGTRYPSAGVFREIARPHRLVMFDEGEGYPTFGHATKVEIWLEAHHGGTRLHLVHGVFKTVEMRNECMEGWSQMFDRLGHMLAA